MTPLNERDQHPIWCVWRFPEHIDTNFLHFLAFFFFLNLKKKKNPKLTAGFRIRLSDQSADFSASGD